jgi:hypothetical protein
MENYKINDLGCAASIITAGYDLDSLERNDRERVSFVFKNSPQLEEIINNYWKNNLQVDARSLVENLKMLKTRIYSER